VAALEDQSPQDSSPYSLISNVLIETVNHPGQDRHQLTEILKQGLERI